MPKAVHFERRKEPRQARSKIQVERIMSVAASLFEKEGYANVSANRIAEVANISIGSVYQYFSSKLAIAFALYEVSAMEVAATIREMAVRFIDASLEEATDRTIDEAFDAFARNDYVLLMMLNEVPELRKASFSTSLNIIMQELADLFFRRHFPQVDRDTIRIKGYILRNSVLALIGQYLTEKPSHVSKEDVVKEIKLLAQMYMGTAENPT
jgi:AcrR family transcriptional regulator